MVIAERTRIGSACFAFAYATLFQPDLAKQNDEGIVAYSSTTRLSAVKYGSADEISAFDVVGLKVKFAEELKKEGLNALVYEQ